MTARGRSGAALLAAVLLAVLAWGGVYIGRTSFVHAGERVFCLWDDAMISMQYARNLADGWGLVWNPAGERVQGITNLGVTLSMALLHLLPVPPAKISLLFQLLNLALLGTVLVAVRELAARATGDAGVAAGALVGTALCCPLLLWSLQGADTGAIAAWLLAALVALARAGGSWPRGLFGFLALGPLLRPDAALFYAAFLVASPAFGGARARRLAAGAGVLAASGAALGLFGLLYYGDPLPNTFYLKATGSPRILVLRSGLLEFGYWPLGLVTALPLVAAALARHGRQPLVSLIALLVATALGYNVLVGGDWKGEYGSRFVAPVLPLLVLLAAAGARVLADALPQAVGPRARTAGVVALAAAVALLASPRLALLDWFDPRRAPMLRAQNAANHELALYLREHTRPTTSIAVHYGGVPPYFSDRRAIDVLGKSERHIARIRVDRFIPGHSKWDWDYVLHQLEPDVFLGTSRGLGRHPDFLRGYYLVRARDGRLRFFLRRSSLGLLTDRDVALFEPATGRPVAPRDALDPRRRAPPPGR
jgi:hypothetical protein